MIPYIIINGKSSKNINGLMIQSLPPITKPKIRTSVEEFDGRDGDIVSVLGYGAYDKTITIGLKGDYDVDEVISFLQQEGKITFSNELDKYYYFSQYDTIDFEKLIRFKTANVNFHIQPFKHSLDEQPLKWTNPGNKTICTFSVRNRGNLKSKPKITIEGTGEINVYIGIENILQIALTNETIIIDAEKMNAYSQTGEYMNRKVIGEYRNLRLPSGVSDLRVTGNLQSVKVENYSLWI